MKKIVYSKTDSLPISIEILPGYVYEVRFGNNHKYKFDSLGISELYRSILSNYLLAKDSDKTNAQKTNSVAFKQGVMITSAYTNFDKMIKLKVVNMKDFTELWYEIDPEEFVNAYHYMVNIVKLHHESFNKDDYIGVTELDQGNKTYMVGYGKTTIDIIDNTNVLLSFDLHNFSSLMNIVSNALYGKKSISIPAVIYGGDVVDVLTFEKKDNDVIMHENGIELIKFTKETFEKLTTNVATLEKYLSCLEKK